MPHHRRSILIVDDEAQILRLFSAMLSKNYKVSTAEDVETAKSLLENEEYDLVISDIVMPGVSGIELVKYLKVYCPKTKLIVMSGIADTLANLHEIGPLPFIEKPFRFKEVLGKIDQELKD